MNEALARAAAAAGVARRLVRKAALAGAAAVVVLLVVAVVAWTPRGGSLLAWLVVAGLAAIPSAVLWLFQRSLAAVEALPERAGETRRQAVDTAGRVAAATGAVRERRGLLRTLGAVWGAGKAARELAGDVDFAPLARLAVPGYLGLAAASVVGVGLVVAFTAAVGVAALL